jgi:hypothetical protein
MEMAVRPVGHDCYHFFNCWGTEMKLLLIMVIFLHALETLLVGSGALISNRQGSVGSSFG